MKFRSLFRKRGSKWLAISFGALLACGYSMSYLGHRACYEELAAFISAKLGERDDVNLSAADPEFSQIMEEYVQVRLSNEHPSGNDRFPQIQARRIYTILPFVVCVEYFVEEVAEVGFGARRWYLPNLKPEGYLFETSGAVS